MSTSNKLVSPPPSARVRNLYICRTIRLHAHLNSTLAAIHWMKTTSLFWIDALLVYTSFPRIMNNGRAALLVFDSRPVPLFNCCRSAASQCGDVPPSRGNETFSPELLLRALNLNDNERNLMQRDKRGRQVIYTVIHSSSANLVKSGVYLQPSPTNKSFCIIIIECIDCQVHAALRWIGDGGFDLQIGLN